MVYQQIVEIPMDTRCAPLIVDLFLICYERDVMPYIDKSIQYDLKDMLNDTSPYRDNTSPSIILNLRNIFLIHFVYIQRNYSLAKQILQTKKLLSFIQL